MKASLQEINAEKEMSKRRSIIFCFSNSKNNKKKKRKKEHENHTRIHAK